MRWDVSACTVCVYVCMYKSVDFLEGIVIRKHALFKQEHLLHLRCQFVCCC